MRVTNLVRNINVLSVWRNTNPKRITKYALRCTIGCFDLLKTHKHQHPQDSRAHKTHIFWHLHARFDKNQARDVFVDRRAPT